MNEVFNITDSLQSLTDEPAAIVWGSGLENDLNDERKVTIIASK